MLNPGSFNRKIKIIFPAEKKFDSMGFPIDSDQKEEKMVWAQVFPINSYEFVKNSAENERKDTTRFVVRYQGNTDINLQCEVFYRGKQYFLTSIVEDYDNRRTITLFGHEVQHES